MSRPPFPPFSEESAIEYHEDNGQWFRAYGNENWQFDAARVDGRFASINEHPITEASARSAGRSAAVPMTIRA